MVKTCACLGGVQARLVSWSLGCCLPVFFLALISWHVQGGVCVTWH